MEFFWTFLDLFWIFKILPSKYFLFWLFPIKIFYFFGILTFKKIPKKEISIPSVKNFVPFFCSLKNYLKRKLSSYLSISQKGNFHSTCQNFCVTFLLPKKMPKKEIFILLVNFLKRKLPFYLSNFCSTFWLPRRTPKKEISFLGKSQNRNSKKGNSKKGNFLMLT